MNVITIDWSAGVPIPIAISWNSWLGDPDGRKIIIIPQMGQRVRKVRNTNSSRRHEQQNRYSIFDSIPISNFYTAYRNLAPQYNPSAKLSSRFKHLQSAPRTWDSGEVGVLIRTRTAQQFGTTSGFAKPQNTQKVGVTTGTSEFAKPQNTEQVGATSAEPPPSGVPKKTKLVRQAQKTIKKPPLSGATQAKPAISQFEKECLDEHNKLRKIHGAPPLKLSRDLCNYAQEWANHLAEIGEMEHRKTGDYGENLFTSNGMKVNARMAVKSWYDEIKLYQFGSGFSPDTGHFTQVVWKNTKEMGCAFSEKGNSVFIVANYNPPGNYQGQFPANVLPPKK